MPRHYRSLAAILLTLLVPAVSYAQEPGEQVIARVEGAEITYAQFSASYVQHLIATGQNDTRRARYAHLERMLDDLLLAQEARRRGMEDAEYRSVMDRRIKQVVGDRYFVTAFLDSVPAPTEADVREAFRRSKEQRVLRHLLFRSQAEAQTAYRRLEAGEDFLRLANEHFQTASFDSSAGALGMVEYWDLDDAVAEATFSLPVGGFSEPVRSRYGWHVLRVEDRLAPPIITESEYQYRREGTRNEVRLRRLRLGGDRFVRGFMEGLDVQVNAEGMTALRSAIREATGEGPEEPAVTVISEEEVRTVRKNLGPETVLATFTLDGETFTFTAEDYAGWMEDLPYKEIRDRPAASVGRALRNEALAARGLSLGLQDDPETLKPVEAAATRYLAGRLREHLRTEGAVKPAEAEVKEGYEKLGFATRPKEVLASYWAVPFLSFEEADRARQEVLEDSSRALRMAGFERHDRRKLSEASPVARELRQVPLREPLVVGTPGGAWHLVQVDDREVQYVTFEEARPDVELALWTYGAELKLLQELRKRADVEVNAEVFERSMAGVGKR